VHTREESPCPSLHPRSRAIRTIQDAINSGSVAGKLYTGIVLNCGGGKPLINVMRRSEDGECQHSELIRSCAVLLGILRGKSAGVKSQSHQFPVQENARINQRHPN
jgi:hypothetical protein